MQTKHQINYQTIVKAPVEKVWQALIDPELVKQYLFGTKQESDWKVGSPIVWTGEYEGKEYIDKGKVLEFKPFEKIAYSYLSGWSDLEDVPDNYLLVEYKLKPVKEGTELTITQSNHNEESAKHSTENWEKVIDELKDVMVEK